MTNDALDRNLRGKEDWSLVEVFFGSLQRLHPPTQIRIFPKIIFGKILSRARAKGVGTSNNHEESNLQRRTT